LKAVAGRRRFEAGTKKKRGGNNTSGCTKKGKKESKEEALPSTVEAIPVGETAKKKLQATGKLEKEAEEMNNRGGRKKKNW